jgi:hypothetical protein
MSGAMNKPKQGPSVYIRTHSAAQVERWRAAAKEDGRSLSDWIRRQLDEASKERPTNAR